METQRADDVVLAEAAAWIARLHGSERTPAVESAFREWLSADPAHVNAFARATDVWDVIPGAASFTSRSSLRPAGMSDELTVNAQTWFLVRWAACAMLLAAIAGVTAFLTRDPIYVTAPGQLHDVTLPDGTRVSLNTNSRLVVAYAQTERRVSLERGEGVFEVTRDPSRPFVVQAGTEQIRALGTTFVVRKEEHEVAVTLIEGKVEISTRSRHLAGEAAGTSGSTVLAPGERAVVRSGSRVSFDRPTMAAVTAWQRGEVMFDDVSLEYAASEINRYGNALVVRVRPELAGLRISGVFQTAHPEEFAAAMARLHRLSVRREDAQIVLSR